MIQQMHVLTSGFDALEAERSRFAHSVDLDTFCEKQEFALNLAGTVFLEAVIEACGGRCHVYGEDAGKFTVESDRPALIQVAMGGYGYAPDRRRHNFTVWAVGEREFVLAFFERLRERYGAARLATVNWWYQSQHGPQCQVVPLEPPFPMRDEFYPWLTEGVDAYLERYLKDRASVLFLMGEPGTGKTSLLRHFIYNHNLAATITYEEKLLETDAMFVTFLTAPEDGVLIVEDADLLVGSRESEGNRLISRFLNVSDGVIKTSGKKIIFTTNLGDFRHVDPALVRSGRCFDAVKFRSLSASEADIAARAAEVRPPGREVTLAELFAPHNAALDIASVGF